MIQTNELTDRRRLAMMKLSILAVLSSTEKLTDCIEDSILSGILAPEELYEIFLQSYLFGGFPCAIEALTALDNVLKRHHISLMHTHKDYNIDYFQKQGQITYSLVYTRVAETMYKRFLDITPDLAQWMIVEGYGKTLSRTGVDIRDRELCIIAILSTTPWEKQLYSHIRGAINVGVSGVDICRYVNALSDCLTESQINRIIQLTQKLEQNSRNQI